jgi:hypothetical protein
LSFALAAATASHLMAVQTAAAADPLEARVAAYWEQRRLKDLSSMYEFYSTSYRAKMPREEFLKLTRLVRFDLRDIAVSQVKASGDTVVVTITYRMLVPTIGAEAVPSQTDEAWIKDVDGAWRKQDEPLVTPFPTLTPPRAQP